jgi:hypothetical protein
LIKGVIKQDKVEQYANERDVMKGMMMQEEQGRRAIDILILSNGPGELATWVKPMVQALRQILGHDRERVRLSVVLSPCPNASGQEVAIAQSYPEVDRVQAAADFFPFLLTGRTAENWHWRPQGVILFLGGDQFFPVVLGWRLGYRTVIYAEWEARWWRWVDRFGVMRPEAMAQIPPKYAHKFMVVGDLMAEVGMVMEQSGNELRSTETPDLHEQSLKQSASELIGILPGSKAAKLAQGLPLMLAIAEHVQRARPQTRFVIPVAPTLDSSTLVQFADPQQNPILALVHGVAAKLVQPALPESPYLETASGLRVDLWQSPPGAPRTPPYELLSQCCLCLTTVGANTAELGALAVPMIVILPTQQLDAMRAWNGIPGLLANLPGVGSGFAKLINWIALQRLGLLAWPNIWAKAEIVPEVVGQLQPQSVAQLMLDYLNHPDKLHQMRVKLRQVRGEPGAARKLAEIVREEVERR